MKIIGRKERIHLPDWGVKNIIAKVDTGAYTSSIHCSHIAVDDGGVLHFVVLDPSHKQYKNTVQQTSTYEVKKVTSSSGQSEMRYKVKTRVVIFEEEIEAEFTLTNRSEMKYPILLGRKLLKGRFLVDVSKMYLAKKSKRIVL